MFIEGLRGLVAAFALAAVLLGGGAAQAAPYAALVMDARTGEVLHSRSADQRLHPASLTKMMTLYLAIEAVKEGRLKLDQKVRVSSNAARQPPSKIGLRTGQRVTIRHLMRAAAVKSANDAAMALAEAVGGSKEGFARMMTQKARALGMTNTTFRNPHGLTERGHLSTARDMAIMGRRLFFDHPEYYNLFSRKKTTAMGKTIYATNRRLLSSYDGADGIKTGYTRAAGFNLVASARRGGKHVIVSMFGGRSSRQRTQRVSELLDMGFSRAPRNAPVIRPGVAVARVSESPVPDLKPTPPQTLLARLGSAIAPAAQASERIAGTKFAPSVSDIPLFKPGGAVAVALDVELPKPRP